MGTVHRGIHVPLETEADRILSEALKGVTRYSEKSDILTPWKEQMRRRREVLVSSGTPDPAIRQGMYHRAASPTHPHLNSRDGVAFPRRRNVNGSLSSFLAESGKIPEDFDD